MDATNTLDQLLAAYAHDDAAAFAVAAAALLDHHRHGGCLPDHLQSFADDLLDLVRRGPVARGALSPAWGKDLSISFRVHVRRDGVAMSYEGDDDSSGDYGCASVRADAGPQDVNDAVAAAFAECVDSATGRIREWKTWRDVPSFAIDSDNGQRSYIDMVGAAEVLQDAAVLSPTPVRFSVSVCRDDDSAERVLVIGTGPCNVPGGADYDQCLAALFDASAAPQVRYQPVYRSGFLWGYLRTEYNPQARTKSATVAESLIDSSPLPAWIVAHYLGEDRPETANEYEWDSVTYG